MSLQLSHLTDEAASPALALTRFHFLSSTKMQSVAQKLSLSSGLEEIHLCPPTLGIVGLSPIWVTHCINFVGIIIYKLALVSLLSRGSS